ncbi:hypothetical protein Dimus_031217 [Dionaea muscipula]
MGEHDAGDDCGLVLPELGLDLAPTEEKVCWGEACDSGGLKDVVGGLPLSVRSEIEEIDGGIGEMPLAGGKNDGQEMPIQFGDFGDDPTLKAMVDSVLHEDSPAPPPRRP